MSHTTFVLFETVVYLVGMLAGVWIMVLIPKIKHMLHVYQVGKEALAIDAYYTNEMRLAEERQETKVPDQATLDQPEEPSENAWLPETQEEWDSYLAQEDHYHQWLAMERAAERLMDPEYDYSELDAWNIVDETEQRRIDLLLVHELALMENAREDALKAIEQQHASETFSDAEDIAF